MGLNGGPLLPQGDFPAPISCVLTNGHMPHATNTLLDCDIPYITQKDGMRYITGIENGTTIGYKYFAFDGTLELTLRVRGTARGRFLIKTDSAELATIEVEPSVVWRDWSTTIQAAGVQALYFCYEGQGSADLLSFALRRIYKTI